MNRTSRFIVVGAISAIAVVAWAQSTSNSTSSSNSRQGGSSSSGSASARASGSGSSGGSFNGGGSASGSMAIPNYAVILTRNPRTANDQIGREFWQEEINYWQQLANRGAVTMAGNWREWDGGLVLLSVLDDRAAQYVADNDPGVKRGYFTATVRAWEVRVVPAANQLPGFGGVRSGGSNQGSSSGSQSGSGGSTVRSGGGK